jgi:dihydroorotase
LAEIGALFEAGAVGFSDAPAPIENTALLKRALEYCTMFDRPILETPEVVALSDRGVMHEDLTQLRLGLAPMPAEAEDLATSRNLRLVEATGGRLHLNGVSTAGSVEICRRVRARDIYFSAGVLVANTHMLDEQLVSFDSALKVNPPLRSKYHAEEICSGLQDGTIDVISSGHRPFSQEKKMLELDAAPFGMIALETAFSQVSTFLVRSGVLNWTGVINKMSTNPARVMNIAGGNLKVGSPADIILINPDLRWKYEPVQGFSRSSNSPFAGTEFQGRVVETIIAGQTKWKA